jgi:hypothetical protein
MVHMLQTAEGIRKAGHPDWFQLVGLLHDMGKIMFLWGAEEDGQIGKRLQMVILISTLFVVCESIRYCGRTSMGFRW